MAKQIGTRVVTDPVVSFAYAHVFEPYAYRPTSPAKYSVTVLIPKTEEETIKAVNAAIDEAIDQAVKTKWNGHKPPYLNHPLHDGDAEKDTEKNPEFKGMMFINAKLSPREGFDDKPQVVNKYGEPIGSDEFYSGCIGAIALNFYGYEFGGQKGVSTNFTAVMKSEDGTRLGGSGSGRLSANDAFGDLYVTKEEPEFNPENPWD